LTLLLLISLAFADPVAGRVMERGTGEPIFGAEVTFDSRTVQTDSEGRFVVDLPSGTWSVAIEAIDYAPAHLGVVVPHSSPIRVYLEPRPPFVVVVEAFKRTPHITQHQVDAEMALETPGTYDDAVRLVQSLPGVAVQREYAPSAGDLNIRASAPGDNRYYLDGVELPYLYHFNQYASVFPTSQIATLDLYPSSYGAAYGDAVGAVIEARSRAERPKTVHGSATLNFVMAGADIRVPLRRGWWVSAAGRRSYQDLFGEATAQYTLWPIFHDFALRAGRDTDHGDTQLFLWGAGDRYVRAAGELDVLDPVEISEAPRFDYRRSFQVLGASHRWKADRARIVAALVYDVLSAELDGGGEQDLSTAYLSSRYDDEWRLAEGLRLTAGYELRAERMALRVEEAGRYGLLVAEEAPALARGESVDDVALRARTGVYGQLSWSVGPVVVLPGVRLASDTLGEPILAEPRLALRWQVGDQTAVKAAVGLQNQAPETEHLVEGTGDPDLPTTSSWQVAAGFEHAFAGRLEVGVDAWGKTLRNVVVYPVDKPAEVAERGRAWGLEVITRYRLREHFFLHGWVGLSRSWFDDPERGWVPGDGDQPFAGGALASWDITDHWNVALRYRIGAGLPYTPVDQGLYDATLDRWDPVSAPQNSARMPLFQKIDLHVAHRWAFPRWSLTISGDLWFVPKSSAQLYPTWNYDFSEQGWVIGPTLLPVLGVRAEL